MAHAQPWPESLRSNLMRLIAFRFGKPGTKHRGRSRFALNLEALEERVLPSLSPHLLRDINVDSLGSSPTQLTQVGATLYLVADDGIHGQELWASNGTAAGTFLVKDINPGIATSYPQYLTNVNGTLF